MSPNDFHDAAKNIADHGPHVGALAMVAARAKAAYEDSPIVRAGLSSIVSAAVGGIVSMGVTVYSIRADLDTIQKQQLKTEARQGITETYIQNEISNLRIEVAVLKTKLEAKR